MRVGWLLVGDDKVGSSRIHGINIHNNLIAKGVSSTVLQSPEKWSHKLVLPLLDQVKVLCSKYDFLIFQKVYDKKAIRLAKWAGLTGCKTIFLQSDFINTKMVNSVSEIVVVSKYLKSIYDAKYGVNCVVIEDAIEVDPILYRHHEHKERLEVVWVGHSDNWSTLEVLREAVSVLGKDFSIKTISNHQDATIRWDAATVQSEVLKADIAAIPCHNDDWSKSKSNNRLTMFMSLGLPVIASPIPAYKDLITDGVDGFLAVTRDDWIRCLSELKQVERRRVVGYYGRKRVLPEYGIDAVGEKWRQLLLSLLHT